jgi:hypothetical protein
MHDCKTVIANEKSRPAIHLSAPRVRMQIRCAEAAIYKYHVYIVSQTYGWVLYTYILYAEESRAQNKIGR